MTRLPLRKGLTDLVGDSIYKLVPNDHVHMGPKLLPQLNEDDNYKRDLSQ